MPHSWEWELPTRCQPAAAARVPLPIWMPARLGELGQEAASSLWCLLAEGDTGAQCILGVAWALSSVPWQPVNGHSFSPLSVGLEEEQECCSGQPHVHMHGGPGSSGLVTHRNLHGQSAGQTPHALTDQDPSFLYLSLTGLTVQPSRSIRLPASITPPHPQTHTSAPEEGPLLTQSCPCPRSRGTSR